MLQGNINKMAFQKGHKVNLGRIQTPETKAKVSMAFKNKTYEEIMGIKKAKQLKEKKSKQYFGEGNPLFNKNHSEETKEIMSKKKDGKNHWGWKDGDAYYRNKFRRVVRKRDNHICMICKIHQEKVKRALDVHHINHDKYFHLKENGICLCTNCHNHIHKGGLKKEVWINHFQQLLSKEYGYVYSKDMEVVIPIT